MKKVSKILSKVFSFLMAIVLIFAAYLFITVVTTEKGKVPSVFGYSFLRVATGSMEPTIHTNTLIIMKKTDPADIKVDDIICFYSTDPKIMNIPNTHRVVEINMEDGKPVFTTKGDANYLQDDYTVTGDRLVGVYQGSLDVGNVLKIMQNRYFLFGLFMLLAVVIFFEILGAKKSREEKEEKKNAQNP